MNNPENRPSIPIVEAQEPLPPVLEPNFFVPLECAFPKKIRDWWMRVGGNKCQYDYYTESGGWQECDKPADHVHHIIPESQLEYDEENPNEAVGIPLCSRHHVKNHGDTLGEWDASFHPDMAEAYDNYAEWKRQQQHMNEISDRKMAIDYDNSPFAETAREHRRKAARGERVCSGDDGTDRYYLEKMTEKAWKYSLEHPEDRKH
jgi:hypothetical protein